MSRNKLKCVGTLLSAALLMCSAPSRADDTEIYFQSGAGLGADPMVMFYLEWSSSMGSPLTGCTGVTLANVDTQCPAIAPVKIYMSPNDLDDGKINQFEMTRAALKRVLAPLGNIKIGLMFSHAQENCDGPQTTVQCSAGGYILKGLPNTPFQTPFDGFNPTNASHLATLLANDAGKKAIFDKLDALVPPQGGISHPPQSKEVYFELFRYLTGQKLHNARNGWHDFGTKANDPNGDIKLGTLPYKNVAKNRWNCATTVPGNICDVTKGTGYYASSGPNAIGDYNGDFVYMGTDPSSVLNNTYRSTYGFSRDTSVENGDYYISPLTRDCGKVFVINVMNATESTNNSDSAIAKSKPEGGMGFDPSNGDIGFEEMVRWLHDVDLADGSINGLQYLDKQNVTSFFVAKVPQDLDAAARAGGTGSAIRLTEDASQVVTALDKILKQVLSVSTTFVSASIPVNVFNRSESLDNAYVALFQADANSQPRWHGNIKKLKLDVYETCAATDPLTNACTQWEENLRFVDTLNQNAVDPIDGRIERHALTFWTHANGYDLYDNINPDTEVAGRDGRSVNRGGAGQQIPGFLNGFASWDGSNYTQYTEGSADLTTGHIESGYPDYRNLYTDTNVWSSKGDLIRLWSAPWDELWASLFIPTDVYNQSQWSMALDYLLLTGDFYNDMFNPGSGTGSFWGLTMLYDKEQLAPYCVYEGYPNGLCPEWPMYMEMIALYYHIYGYDFWGEKAGFTLANWWEMFESRRWVMGDALHSRPLPVNYGARGGHNESNPDIRIITGSNDGFLRMIRNTNSDGSESGQEVWAYMPREVMRVQKQLMDNAAGGSPIHPYGVDGPPVAYVKDSNGTILESEGDEAYIFFGLRRGGRAYYALNIINPDNPTFAWKVTPASAGFEELGYTFSEPVVRKLDWGAGAKPVLIVGGGYDTNKDIPALGTNDTIGNAIYIINAITGELVWKTTDTAGTNTYVNAEMVDSIPSDITTYDADQNGEVDRLYVGDTGGRVWRIDLPAGNPSAWKSTVLLDLGRHVTANLANDRRFFHSPDIVPTRDANGAYDAVVIGSGNREHPLQTYTDDYMYMYKDRVVSGELTDGFTAVTPADLGDVTDNCLQEIGITCTVPNLSQGWKLGLTEDGEKSLSTPLTLRNVVYFSTYLPATSVSQLASCGPNEGTGYLYAISLQNAVAVYNYDATNSVTDSSGNLLILQIDDRKRKSTDGIPAESKYVHFVDRDGEGVNPNLNVGDGATANAGPRDFDCVLTGLECEDPKGNSQWRTFWYEKQK